MVYNTDKYFMEMCLDEALKAYHADEVPVGAIIVSDRGEVISKAYNLTITNNSPIAHAEILAIQEAAKRIGNYRLNGCVLFVSKEPCIMCTGAIIEARIKRVVFGCFDKKRGGMGSLIDVNSLPLNHKVVVKGGILAEKSGHMLKEFFKMRRGTEAVITGPTRNRLYVL